jgi:hypothetical protein
LIERYVERVVVMPEAVEVSLILPGETIETGPGTRSESTKLTVPWSDATFAVVKGIVHAPTKGGR